MKALVLHGPNDLRFEELPKPENLQKGQVLVKMAYAPINPSDLAFLTGNYGIKKEYPVVPGLEGSGTVVSSGGGLYANYLKGKNVACVAGNQHGTWAEYMLADATRCVVLGGSVSLEQGAMAFVNPLTAIEMVDIAKKGNYSAIVLSAAGSALAKMIVYQAEKVGIPVVGIVRKAAQEKELRNAGFAEVFVSSQDMWQSELKQWAKGKGKMLFLDAIGGGAVPFAILAALPAYSKMLTYGRLDPAPPEMNPRDFIFQAYQLEGYWLNRTAGQKTFLQAFGATRKVQDMLKNGFETQIQGKFAPTHFEKAIEQYAQHMSNGKVLFEF
ncbi:alcohol dehydrogenase catalytic domain-containing protein [Marinilongibacter aquaticus]|uniref:alcohol dehydrogenase catalytic domain-containing protein n=1 Tax=Marinilongibacter aquaticus TaxID=2975157 RepID=UPI0021BD753C|nr:alcohol dehydrogenase catalytic domain-containing protein [Marinilongibacter aquaticus]UBM60387.1 alcohol dehydrogenase catalytic domain-containing protein [Marinilongibacter aquaticus]